CSDIGLAPTQGPLPAGDALAPAGRRHLHEAAALDLQQHVTILQGAQPVGDGASAASPSTEGYFLGGTAATIPPKKRRRYPPRRSLLPPHQTLLLWLTMSAWYQRVDDTTSVFRVPRFVRGGSRGQGHLPAPQELTEEVQGRTPLLPARPPHRHQHG